MTITPNDLASNSNNPESSAPKAGDQEAKFTKATKKVKAKRQNQEVKSIIYETSPESGGRRLLVDRHNLPLPPAAQVHVDVEPGGSGMVTARIPAARVQVIPAGKKIVTRRPKRSVKKGDE